MQSLKPALSSTNPRWIRPSRILYASEAKSEEPAFHGALSMAQESGAKLILLHVFDVLATSTEDASGMNPVYYENALRRVEEKMQPMLRQAQGKNVSAEVVVRAGIAATQILACARERNVDRIVMGTRAPGRLGKFFIGSVAEEVLRSAQVPVITFGPNALDPRVHSHKLRRLLCTVSHLSCDLEPALLAGQIAALHEAQLTVLHMMPPRATAPLDPGCSTTTLEAELKAMLPRELQYEILVRALPADSLMADEILFQAHERQSDLIVLGAHPASLMATLTRQGLVNQVLAKSMSPVMTIRHPVQQKQQAVDYLAESTWLAGIF